jgi:hypothetical protein
MSAPEKMNDLTARKRLLIAQADLHRHLIELECGRMLQRLGRTRDAVHQKRWWLLGGAAAGGFLLPAKWRRLLALLPLIPDFFRMLRDE